MYYYPCKPNRLAPESGYFNSLDNDPRWIAEVKKNGWRCLAYREKESLVLYTRHHTLITDPLQEVRNYLFVTLAPGTILDGELINNRTKDVKSLYYVFDVIASSGDLLVNCSLSHRRSVLEKLVRPYPGVVELAAQTITGKKRLYESSIQTSVNEGIVIKRLDSKYLASETRCLQNPYWLKVKRPDSHLFVQI
jgi:ATP-dependent DNA ligase